MKQRLQGIIIGVMATVFIFFIILTVLGASRSQNIEVTYRDIKLYIDDKMIMPTDSNGNIVEPFIYKGTTYLPVRAIGEAFGKEIGWNEDTGSVYIGKRESKASAESAPASDFEYYAYKNDAEENPFGLLSYRFNRYLKSLHSSCNKL